MLQRAWGECVPGMEFALNFLRSNASIDSPALLSSPFLLVTLGYYGFSAATMREQRASSSLNRTAHRTTASPSSTTAAITISWS
jgi:hypothetical protein